VLLGFAKALVLKNMALVLYIQHAAVLEQCFSKTFHFANPQFIYLFLWTPEYFKQ